MARRKGRKEASVKTTPHPTRIERAPKQSGFFDFDVPYDIRPSLINHAALAKLVAQGNRIYHDPAKAGAGFGLRRSTKPRRPVQGKVNNIATYLEQSDADAWAQALNEMSTEQPVGKKSKKSEPTVSPSTTSTLQSGRSAADDSRSTSIGTCSPAATRPANKAVATKKRKSYAMDVDIASLEATQDRCKKHAGQRNVTWSQDEGGDIVMCSCADLSHIVRAQLSLLLNHNHDVKVVFFYRGAEMELGALEGIAGH